MDKRKLVKLALAGMTAGLVAASAQSAQAEECQAQTPTTLAAAACNGGAGCTGGGRSNRTSKPTADATQYPGHSCGGTTPSHRNTNDGTQQRYYNDDTRPKYYNDDTQPKYYNDGSQRYTSDNAQKYQNDNAQQRYTNDGSHMKSAASDAFRNSLDKQTQDLYDTLDPETKKAAWEMVNKNSGKDHNEAVREAAAAKKAGRSYNQK